MHAEERQQQLAAALAQVTLPAGIEIRAWTAADFPAIQQLSSAEGWTSPAQRSADSLLAWQHSWPALVAVEGAMVVGFVRGLTDGAITTYIADMAVDARLRGRGIGRALLDACHFLYPTTRLDLLAVDDARAFYRTCGFRTVYEGMRKSYV
ncbi:MAG: GNAT family N-acetyltransferase [Ktedonobacteraceae bacterium]|nr:GNAT family N-acetyltransferase [Ktedonobacteraceae bacterium]